MIEEHLIEEVSNRFQPKLGEAFPTLPDGPVGDDRDRKNPHSSLQPPITFRRKNCLPFPQCFQIVFKEVF